MNTSILFYINHNTKTHENILSSEFRNDINDFDIETVSDVLSLLLKMDEQLDMDFEGEKDDDGSFIPSTIKISFKNSLLNHKLGVYMKARELQENLLNDTERFSS